MNPDELWIDVKTVSEIKGVTPRAIRLALNRGNYTFRQTDTQGGKSYQVLLSSLEQNIQEVYSIASLT